MMLLVVSVELFVSVLNVPLVARSELVVSIELTVRVLIVAASPSIVLAVSVLT
jgi:hypothetical protein